MKKKWLIGLAVLAVLSVCVYLYLKLRKSDDFEGPIKAKLAKMVHKASNGLYALNIKDLEIDVLKSTITAHDVTLIPDSIRQIVLEKYSELPDDILTVSVKKILIKGISPTDLLDSKNIDLSQIVIDSPDVLITHKKRIYNSKDTTTFYEKIAEKDETYSLDNLLLNQIRLTHKNLDKDNKMTILYNLTAVLDDIKLDSETAKDSTRFFFAKDAVIYAKKYSTVTADKLYRFSIDSIALKPQQGNLEARAVKFEPLDSKNGFSDKHQFKTDMFNLYFEDAGAVNVNWWQLLSGEGLELDRVKLTGGYIQIYNDARLPSEGISKVGKYPHQLVNKAGFPINLKQLLINNIDVSYEEFNPVSDTFGKVEFKNTSGQISNVTNVPEIIAANNWMKMEASSLLMGKGQLKTQINFDLKNATAGNFTVDATVSTMDGKALNKASKGLGLVGIEDLTLDKLETHLKGNNNQANGTVTFLYHDLKIAALKTDGDKFKKRALISFIANNFVVKSQHPQKGKPVKVQQVTYKRDPNRSFFNLIWQSMAAGIIQTAKGK